jgi:diguanylate cyclase (GGDEF)-like protein
MSESPTPDAVTPDLASIDLAAISAGDPDHAIQLAPRIWWVGHQQVDDPFQCHAYLIEQGDQSVLIDPGGARTFSHTLRKIEEIIPFSSIKYFLCQHQDPDITASLPAIEKICRPDAEVVTHWRVQMLIKHYGVDLKVHLIEEGAWELKLQDRTLRFIFTPYAHFPGAFCTFDPVTGILFSSDLFGGLTKEFALLAQDESYFEAMRPFHEHYIPTREILQFAIDEIRPYPVTLVAPQHGSIIPPHLVRQLMDRLYTLDCGLYLLSSTNTDIERLSRLNESLRAIVQAVTMTRDFKDIVSRLLDITRQWLPVQRLEFFSRLDGDDVLHLAPESHYRGMHGSLPGGLDVGLGGSWREWLDSPEGRVGYLLQVEGGTRRLLIPLTSGAQTVDGLAMMTMDDSPDNMDEMRQLVHQLAEPLGVALEREGILRDLEEKREAIYQRSIRDPLTQLYTRIYMQDAVGRMCRLQDRGQGQVVTVALLDIDHFKSVNDTFGHNMGDTVLQDVSRTLMEETRGEVDIAVRLGGEELIVFAPGLSADDLHAFAERMRLAIAALTFPEPMHERQITVSIGTAFRRAGEALKEVIQRADEALYKAKTTGRNQTCTGG